MFSWIPGDNATVNTVAGDREYCFFWTNEVDKEVVRPQFK